MGAEVEVIDTPSTGTSDSTQPTVKITEAPEELIKQIDVNLPLEKGANYYLISDKWFSNFQRFCRFSRDADDANYHPGPIDNSYLFDSPGVKIREALVERLHYYLLTHEQWEKLVSWFGSLHPPIIRNCIETQGYSKQRIVEVYPRKITIQYKPENAEKQEIDIEISRAATIADLKKVMCEHFKVPNDDNARIKKKDTYFEKELNDMEKDIDSVLDTYLTDKVLLEIKDSNGEWPAETSNSYSSISTYPYSGSYPSTSSSRPSSSYESSSSWGSSSKYDGYSNYSSSYSNYSSSSYSSKYDNYSNYYSSKTPPEKGATGLNNLGNTCFMNSGIQCLSNTRPLVKHFLEKKHIPEINKTNPLGMEGKIAEEFGELIQDIWSGKNYSVSPRELKSTIGRFAPQFSGYNQQDSQELLAFLLDGLHEDLNRIVKKPYIEIKDSAGRSDKDVADEAWEAHKKRNDSIITDLFLGQFKSRVTCPECKKISLTFDPFLFLSLPLPALETRPLVVTFVPKDPSKKLQKIKFAVPKRGFVTILRDKVSEFVGVPKSNIALTEVFSNRFHTFYSSQALREIRDDDEVYAYETEAPVKVPLEEDKNETGKINVRLLIQVLTLMSYNSSYRSTFTENKGVPLIFSVDQDITYPDLYKEVQRQLNRFSSKPLEELEKDLSAQESEMSEMEDVAEVQTSKPEQEDTPMEEERIEKTTKIQPLKALFKIQATQSYSSSNDDLDTSGKPLGLRDNAFIAAVWEKDNFAQVFGKNFKEGIEEIDASPKEEKEQKLSVQTCLELFLKEEVLGAENTWFCPQCKEDRQANKKFDIWRLPDILVVHLKRFSYNSYHRDKIDSLVEFPLKDLDLSSYVLNNDDGEQYLYDLFAVSNHFGGLGGGHYTAYGKNAVDGNWYNFDDSTVTKMDSDSVQTAAAYVLFYQRKGKFEETSPLPVVEQVPIDASMETSER